MKQFFLLLLAVSMLAVSISGCGSASGGDPRATLMAFSEKLSKKDFEGAKQLATKASASYLDLMKKFMGMAEQFKNMPGYKEETDFNKVTIGEPKINGDIALVPFTSGGKSFDYPMKKEDGAWKVDLTAETMSKMGMDGANSKDMEKGMEEMKNINMDTLMKGMEEMKEMMKPENMEKMKKMGEDMQKQIESMKQ